MGESELSARASGDDVVLLNWDSQQGRPSILPSQSNFAISFKPKVAIARF